MSIQSEITRINSNIGSAYTAVDDMGGTLPATQNSANLASAIRTISGGGTSLPSDPSTDGTYKLINTVETEGGTQSATLSWEEDSGGGTAYTAGDNILLENNIISSGNGAVPPIFNAGLDSNTVAYSGLPIKTFSSTATAEMIIKYLNANYIISFSSNLNIAKSDLYNAGLASVYEVYNYSVSSGDYPGKTFVNLSGSGDYSFQTDKVYVKNGTNQIYRYDSLSNYKNIVGRSLCDVIINKNTYTNFSGFRLNNYLNGIDSALTKRIPDSLSSTDTAPSTNNTINWVYA